MNPLRIKIAAAMILLVLLPFYGAQPAAAQSLANQPPTPEMAARAWTLMDVRTGEILSGGNSAKPLPMASTTKIMLALVTLKDANLDEEVVISQEAASYATPKYSNVGLFAGDTLSVRELLMASLISSGDDAAHALAEHLGDGDVENFVEKMNREAEELGLGDTHFENPVGFDARDHHSSARDLAKMARAAMEHPEFRELVATTETSITTQDREIPLANTNELLSTYGPATGVKTGTTPAAGPSLVSAAKSGNESYIAVVLDDEQRFIDSAALLEYGFEAYDRRNLVSKGEQYTKIDVPYRRGREIDLVAKKDVPGLVKGKPDVEREVSVRDELPGSVRPGAKLGEIVVKVGGERVGVSALVARKGYEEASVGEKVWYTVEGVFE